ncbi:MAG: hypothetical protein ABSG49_02615 [Methanoregula sp.]
MIRCTRVRRNTNRPSTIPEDLSELAGPFRTDDMFIPHRIDRT